MRHIPNAYKIPANFIEIIPAQNTIDVSDTTSLTMRKIGIFVWIEQLAIFVVLPIAIIAIGNPSRRPRNNRRTIQLLQQHPMTSTVKIELGIKNLMDRLDG